MSKQKQDEANRAVERYYKGIGDNIVKYGVKIHPGLAIDILLEYVAKVTYTNYAGDMDQIGVFLTDTDMSGRVLGYCQAIKEGDPGELDE